MPVVEREDVERKNDVAVDRAELEAAGLYDPAAPNAADRIAVLQHLLERGARIPDLVVALEEGGLSSYSGELVRGRGRPRLTPEDVAAAAGVPVEAVLAVSRAAGLPRYDAEEPVYRDEDIETFQIFAAGVEVFGENATLEFTRAIGAALAGMADAAIATFGSNLAGQLGEVSELDQAHAFETASSLLVTQVPKVLDMLFFHHVEAAIRRDAAAGGTMQNPHVTPLAVGFLDLVGSTTAVVELTPEDLGAAIGEFERQAIDIVAFGGLARGYGDFFGADVNVAARLVTLAEPGVLLVTAAVRERVGDGAGVRFEPAGERRLRGFTEPVAVYALERA